MSLAQLSYFIAVAEEEHLTRAAHRLCISQPPLSRQIKSLEDELETQLFERVPSGMRLLPAGEVLLTEARDIVDRLEQLKTELKKLPDPPLSSSPRQPN